MKKHYQNIIIFIGFCIFALGIYGFTQSTAIEATFKFFHALGHVVTGLSLMYFAYSSEMKARIWAQFLGVFYIPLIIESFVAHNGMIEYHVLTHVVIAGVLLWLGFGCKEER